MKILLINNNPVVSRLTALSAKKENIALEEIKNISELKASDYNIIFVDGESYNNDVSNIIRNSGVEKRVLFYAEGEEQNQSVFTQSILKPFLPSEVSEILRETKVTLLNSNKEKLKEDKAKENINFQDLVEESKNKELELLNIIEKKEPTVAFSSSTVTSVVSDKKAIEKDVIEKDVIEKDVIKKDVIEKDMFDLDLDSDLFELDSKKESTPSIKEDDLFEIDDKKKNLKEVFEENIFDENLFKIDKEIEKDILNDLPLDFDIESKDEVSFSTNTSKIKEEPKVEEVKVEEPKVEEPKVEEPKVEEPKVEEPKVEEPKVEEKKVKEDINMTAKSEVTTKVLNNEDISDIMDILDEKEGSEKLTEIPTSLMKVQESLTEKNIDTKKSIDREEILKQDISEKKEMIEEKKIQEEKTASDDLSTGVAIADKLSRLPIKELRELLRGAKVNISIEFSNKI